MTDLVFLETSPNLRLSRGSTLNHGISINKLTSDLMGLVMNNKRHFHHSGNFKSFRSSGPGIQDKEQMFIFYFNSKFTDQNLVVEIGKCWSFSRVHLFAISWTEPASLLLLQKPVI